MVEQVLKRRSFLTLAGVLVVPTTSIRKDRTERLLAYVNAMAQQPVSVNTVLAAGWNEEDLTRLKERGVIYEPRSGYVKAVA